MQQLLVTSDGTGMPVHTYICIDVYLEKTMHVILGPPGKLDVGGASWELRQEPELQRHVHRVAWRRTGVKMGVLLCVLTYPQSE